MLAHARKANSLLIAALTVPNQYQPSVLATENFTVVLASRSAPTVTREPPLARVSGEVSKQPAAITVSRPYPDAQQDRSISQVFVTQTALEEEKESQPVLANGLIRRIQSLDLPADVLHRILMTLQACVMQTPVWSLRVLSMV